MVEAISKALSINLTEEFGKGFKRSIPRINS
jgi:hypothetical protein